MAFLSVGHPFIPNHFLRYKRDHLLLPCRDWRSDIEEKVLVFGILGENREKRHLSSCNVFFFFPSSCSVLYVWRTEASPLYLQGLVSN